MIDSYHYTGNQQQRFNLISPCLFRSTDILGAHRSHHIKASTLHTGVFATIAVAVSAVVVAVVATADVIMVNSLTRFTKTFCVEKTRIRHSGHWTVLATVLEIPTAGSHCSQSGIKIRR